ncbi:MULTISPECIES: sugar kinase [unclassified Streptomyces]|uniref:sugar kinase n=1 Tax=unclassified Streptomyces TaxID=2593676 RepID=UPI002E2B979D|nr:sugar kinase [Streptomyces sp. NBC_00223]
MNDAMGAIAGDTGRPTLVAVGEGLLEVGVRADLPRNLLGRGFGGDVPNAAVMASRLGVNVRLLTRLGTDTAGRLLLDFWRESGVDVGRIVSDADAPTGVYINDIGPRDHRFDYYRSSSAATLLHEGDVDAESLNGADALYISGISMSISESSARAVEHAAALARKRGVKVAFCVNYRPALRPDPDRLLALARTADVVISSGDDMRGLLGSGEPELIRRELGPGPAEIVVTSGGSGAVVDTGKARHHVPAPRVRTRDTACAGDALAGTYMAMRLTGAAPHRALSWGVLAGALSCRGVGCAQSYPSADELARARTEVGDDERVFVGD